MYNPIIGEVTASFNTVFLGVGVRPGCLRGGGIGLRHFKAIHENVCSVLNAEGGLIALNHIDDVRVFMIDCPFSRKQMVSPQIKQRLMK